MIRTKLGLLGLCAMVFGLMAFSATGAHAEATARWLVLDSLGKVKEGSTLHAQVQLKKDTLSVLHSKILGIEVLFLCEEISAVNAFLQKEGIIAKEINAEGKPVGAQVLFSGCTTDLNGKAAPECVPKDAVDGEGKIVTKLGHALAELFELKPSGVKDDIVLILPDVGETFAVVEMSAACPIGTKVPVIGKLAIKDCKELALEHLIEHLIETFTPATELWTISKTEEHKATLLGSSWARLLGEHAGLKWSISNL